MSTALSSKQKKGRKIERHIWRRPGGSYYVSVKFNEPGGSFTESCPSLVRARQARDQFLAQRAATRETTPAPRDKHPLWNVRLKLTTGQIVVRPYRATHRALAMRAAGHRDDVQQVLEAQPAGA